MFCTERSFFVSRAIQRELPPDFVLPDAEVQIGEEIILMVPIILRLFELFGRGSHRWIGDARDVTYDGRPIFVNQVVINCSVSLIKSRRRRFLNYMSRQLTRLGVPFFEQPPILQNMADAVEVALPYVPISVSVVNVTVKLFGEGTPITGIFAQLLGSVSSSETIIDAPTWDFMETYIHEDEPASIPATQASIEGLEYLRLDDLEEDVIIQASPCAICLEQLDYFDTDQLMGLIRLPCSHLYHRACIIPWLGRCHLCPLCQCSVEPEARREQTKPSQTQDWTMLLWLCAGGVITTTLVCRLWKQTEG